LSLSIYRYFLKRAKMPDFLDVIERGSPPPEVSVYLPPGVPAAEIAGLAGDVWPGPGSEIIGEAAGSKTGAVMFAGGEINCLVLPPFPVREKVILPGCDTGPLRHLLASEYEIGLVLVHLGSYAVGLCRGDRLVSSKVGTGLVHGRTKKGGSSSQRFQRRRENQGNEFLDRVCRRTVEHIGPRVKSLDYIIYGGPRQTVLKLKKRCPLLMNLEDKELPLMEVPEVRRKVMEAAVERTWASRVIEWREE
jgi:hypothetical protein